MKTKPDNTQPERRDYAPPIIDILSIAVEAGFAVTNPSPDADPSDWNDGGDFWG